MDINANDLPLRFALSFPHDTIFSIIDPDKIGTENELHFEWANAEIKARFTALCFISLLYFRGIYFYKRFKEEAI